MNFSMSWRDRRNFLAPPHYPFASYSTETKSEMKNAFGDELFLNSLCLGPDPLRKNLADTIITEEKMATKNNKNKLETEMKPEEVPQIHEDPSPLAGITNFFSGVLSVISNAMFSKRKPDFSTATSPEMALPAMWHGAKDSDENKILVSSIDTSSEVSASEMGDCRSAAAHCQSKLDQVRVLLGSSKPVPCSLRVRRRPKRVFVDQNSVEDCFVDAFSPEDFQNLVSDSYIEYSSPVCHHDDLFHEIDGPQIKVEKEASMVIPEPLKEVPAPPTAPKTQKTVTKTQEVIALPPKVRQIALVDSKAPKETTTPPQSPKTLEKVAETQGIVSVSPKIIVAGTQPLYMKPEMIKEPSQTLPDNPLVCETTEIVKNVPELPVKLEPETKKEIVESCEDKITKLKLLLQERRKKSKVIETPVPIEQVTLHPTTRLEPEPHPLVTLPPKPKPSTKVKDKRFKNPNRCSDKRRKSRMKKNIQEDMLFANEINPEDLSSVENSPSTNNMEKFIGCRTPFDCSEPKPVPQKEFFNEVSGRFQSGSVESDDSFQIVFHDSPKPRLASDCDSEDSFIIFEDTPDSCYTSNEVFGDTTDSEDYDSDSDVSDSGCGTFQLSGSLSKSVGNLADDSLYVDHSEDEVDCANMCRVSVSGDVTVPSGDACDSNGVLVKAGKTKKDSPVKRVHFSPLPPKVHVMRVWLFAAKQTRRRYWEQFVVDRERFKRRINDVDMAVSWVLKPQHRSRVMFQRFMPWWNAQKRKEIAEKKEREAQEKLEEEEKRKEEIKRQESKLNEEITDNSLPEERKGDAEVEISRSKSENESLDSESVPKNSTEKCYDDIKNISKKTETEKLNAKNRESKSLVDNNSKHLGGKTFSDKIVPYNEKILDLNPEYVGSILNT